MSVYLNQETGRHSLSLRASVSSHSKGMNHAEAGQHLVQQRKIADAISGRSWGKKSKRGSRSLKGRAKPMPKLALGSRDGVRLVGEDAAAKGLGSLQLAGDRRSVVSRDVTVEELRHIQAEFGVHKLSLQETDPGKLSAQARAACKAGVISSQISNPFTRTDAEVNSSGSDSNTNVDANARRHRSRTGRYRDAGTMTTGNPSDVASSRNRSDVDGSDLEEEFVSLGPGFNGDIDSDSDSGLDVPRVPPRLSRRADQQGRLIAEAASHLNRVSADGQSVNFDNALYNGTRVYGEAAGKVHKARFALAELLNDAHKNTLLTHPGNDTLGFSINLVRGTITLLVKDSANSDNISYQRFVYNFNDETSIREFIDEFGRDDLTISDVKDFITEVKGRHTKSGEYAPVSSLGTAKLDADTMMDFFAPEAREALKTSLGVTAAPDRASMLRSFKRVGAEQHAKTAVLKDYYTAALSVPQLTARLRAEVQKREETLKEVNEQKAQAMAVFLKQAIRRNHNSNTDVTVRQTLEEAVSGQRDKATIFALFAATIDHAKHVAAQNPDLNNDQRKEFVSSQAQLLINIVNREMRKMQAEATDPDQVTNLGFVVRDLRLIQDDLVQKSELVDLSYDAAVTDLEASLAFDSQEDIQADIERFNKAGGNIVGAGKMRNLKVTPMQISRTLNGRALRTKVSVGRRAADILGRKRIAGGVLKRSKKHKTANPEGALENSAFAQKLEKAQDHGRNAAAIADSIFGAVMAPPARSVRFANTRAEQTQRVDRADRSRRTRLGRRERLAQIARLASEEHTESSSSDFSSSDSEMD